MMCVCIRRIAHQEESGTFAVACFRVDVLKDDKYLPTRQRSECRTDQGGGLQIEVCLNIHTYVYAVDLY